MNESMLSSRKMFRNVVILACLLLFALAFFAFRFGQGIRQEIQMLDFDRIALVQELQNTARRSANLAELDSLTISEAEATRLNIMRHLGLEQNNYNFEVTNRQIRQVNEVELYTREAVLRTSLPYAQTLALMDRLYNTGKLAIQRIELKITGDYGDVVDLDMVGNIYALRKEGAEEILSLKDAQQLPTEQDQDIPQDEQIAAPEAPEDTTQSPMPAAVSVSESTLSPTAPMPPQQEATP